MMIPSYLHVDGTSWIGGTGVLAGFVTMISMTRCAPSVFTKEVRSKCGMALGFSSILVALYQLLESAYGIGRPESGATSPWGLLYVAVVVAMGLLCTASTASAGTGSSTALGNISVDEVVASQVGAVLAAASLVVSDGGTWSYYDAPWHWTISGLLMFGVAAIAFVDSQFQLIKSPKAPRYWPRVNKVAMCGLLLGGGLVVVGVPIEYASVVTVLLVAGVWSTCLTEAILPPC